MTACLSRIDFEPCLHRAFTIDGGGDNAVDLVLAEVSELTDMGRVGGSFRLEFHGPTAPVLPQSLYTFKLDGGPQDIFIVPIAVNAERATYEAIFC